MTPWFGRAAFALLLFLPSVAASAPASIQHEVLYFHADGTMDPTAGSSPSAAQAGAFRAAPAAAPFVLKPGAIVYIPSSVLLSSATVVQLLANGTVVGAGRAAASLLHVSAGVRTVALQNKEITLPAGTVLIVTIAGGGGLLSLSGGSGAPRLEFDRVAYAAATTPAPIPTPQATPAAPTVGPPAPGTSDLGPVGATRTGASDDADTAVAPGTPTNAAATTAPSGLPALWSAFTATANSAWNILAARSALLGVLAFLAVAAFAGMSVARVGRA